MAIDMPPTPELDKVQANREQSQAIGAYLEWLESEGVHLMRWVEEEVQEKCEGNFLHECNSGYTERGSICQQCGGTGTVARMHRGYVPVPGSIQQKLAAYFGINLQKVDAEQTSLLKAVREAQGLTQDGH